MKQESKTVNLWENLYSQQHLGPKYPEDAVIRFAFNNLTPGQKVLDLGCGAGRHAMFLAENGFEAYGIDISENAILEAKKRAQEKNLSVVYKVASCESIPFEDEFFNALIACGTIYYGDVCMVQHAASEIFRLLTKGGKALIVVRSLEDYRYSRSLEIEPHTIIINEQDQAKSAANENGMKMHFFNRAELLKLFSNFARVDIERQIVTHGNESYADNDFLVFLQK
ncbi:MAG: methyltransferase domain-containing protein [Oscillospiraceae bacterium]|nr:methyltransferase domain-containing protein [Oscillospiraceae bacterium]